MLRMLTGSGESTVTRWHQNGDKRAKYAATA